MGSKKNGNKVAPAHWNKGNLKEAKAWAEYYGALVKPHEEVVPKGWYSGQEVGLLLGRKDGSVENTLRRLRREGKIESKQFLRCCGAVTKPVFHYKLAKVKSAKNKG